MFETLLALLALLFGDDAELTAAVRDAGPSEDPARPLAAVADATLEAVSAALTEAAANDEISTETVVSIADSLDAIRVEDETRDGEAEAEAAARDEALKRIHAEADETGGEGDEADTETDETEEEEETEDSTEKVPVLASAPRRPSVSRVAARRPAAAAPASPVAAAANMTLLVDAGSDFERGQRFGSIEELSVAVSEAINENAPTKGSGWPKKRLARIGLGYPEERRLSKTDIDENTRKVRDAVLGTRSKIAAASGMDKLRALTASGGLCAPLSPYYPLAQLGDAGRPLRTCLPGFQADRGGITFVPPPSFAAGAYDGGVTVWTAANDANPENPAVKPCLVMTCDEAEDVTIEAITECLEVGNFRNRTYPEQVANFLHGLALVHARTAETEIVNVLSDPANTTVITAPAALGVSRDLFFYLDLFVGDYRDRHRMASDEPVDFYGPERLRNAIRADRVRELPGSIDETFCVTDAWIAEQFACRNIRPCWFRDTQNAGVQAVGAGNLWPTTFRWFFHHPGAFLFLDGGMLNLGIDGGQPIVDSALVETNDFRLFAETFEAVAYVGIESIAVDMGVCVSGATSGTVDPLTLCSTE